MTDEDDLEKIREEKRKELQNQQEEQEREIERRKQSVLQSILTEDARARLKNLEMVDQEKVEAVREMLISQSERINEKITDQEMKQILRQVNQQESNTSFNIKSRDLE